MSYQTIKTYLSRRMSTHGFFEAKKKFDFENSGENYDNLFIVENPKSELNEGDTLATHFNPMRTYTIKLAKKISETGIQYDYDSFQAKLDGIVKDIHNPVNYRADSIRRVQWESTEVKMEKDYLSGIVTFNADDALTYA